MSSELTELPAILPYSIYTHECGGKKTTGQITMPFHNTSSMRSKVWLNEGGMTILTTTNDNSPPLGFPFSTTGTRMKTVGVSETSVSH